MASKEQSDSVILRNIQTSVSGLADTLGRHISETRESFHKMESTQLQTKSEIDSQILLMKADFTQREQVLRSEIQAVDSRINLKEASKETKQLSDQNSRRERVFDGVVQAISIAIILFLLGSANVIKPPGVSQALAQPQVIYMAPPTAQIPGQPIQQQPYAYPYPAPGPQAR